MPHSKLSALKVKEPKFYFRNESPYWLSRIEWEKNINKDVAIVGEDEELVYGIAEIREPVRIKNIEDIFEKISKSAFKTFRKTRKDVWAYPVVVKHDFSDNPRQIREGLEDGQRNWIREVEFFRQRKENYENMDLSTLQSYHDKIHHYYQPEQSDFRLVNHHYFIAKEFEDRDINHPWLDALDLQYKKMTFDMDLQDIDSYKNGIEHVKDYYSSKKDRIVGLSVISEEFNQENKLLENLGNWTPDLIMQWEPSLSEEEAVKASRQANMIFMELIGEDVSLNTAIQRSLQMAVARAKNNE